jgi:hypothetical protein
MAQIIHSADGRNRLDILGQSGEYIAVALFVKSGSGWIPTGASTNWTEQELNRWKQQENVPIAESTSMG